MKEIGVRKISVSQTYPRSRLNSIPLSLIVKGGIELMMHLSENAAGLESKIIR